MSNHEAAGNYVENQVSICGMTDDTRLFLALLQWLVHNRWEETGTARLVVGMVYVHGLSGSSYQLFTGIPST